MGTGTAQALWIIVAAGLILLPSLWWFGIPVGLAAMIAGALAAILCLAVLIRPFRRSDWEDFWERLSDWLRWW